MDGQLFDKGPVEARDEKEILGGTPRLRVPIRNQIEMKMLSLDQILDPNHPARIVWATVCGLDLTQWTQQIKSVERNVGRAATDPRLLVALWIYATLDGVGSARQLARLCNDHVAYQWLCGGVTVNHHMLSDFRSQNGEAWDELLTQIVGSLLNEGLVELNRVAQDGMRVRASAGKSSFRRKPTLENCLDDARRQVEILKQLVDESPDELTARQQAARERAARERQERIENAIQNCDDLQNQREKRAKRTGQPAKAARASTTDPEARVMQFSDGGFRPGYNVQFATDVESGVIVGVDVTNVGNDSEQLPIMLEQIDGRYKKTPNEALVDGGFTTREAVTRADERGCVVYGPIKDEQKQLEEGKDPYEKKKRDNKPMAEWRKRMGTEAAKTLYRLRCQSAEWVNAMARNRGFQQMPVRGQTKCRSIALLYAITHNVMRGVALRAADAN